MLSYIYKATNTYNSKVYIGYTCVSFESRVQQHKVVYKKNKTKFYSAIRKYGWETFCWEILYMSRDHDHCHRVMEQYFIREYNSCVVGYNTTEGGAGVIGAVRGQVWVNNGIKHKRVFKETIPEGWQVGRVGVVRKVRSKWKSTRTPRRSYTGENNPAAKTISINGKVYNTMRAAVTHLKTSAPTIRLRCKSRAPEYADWFYKN